MSEFACVRILLNNSNYYTFTSDPTSLETDPINPFLDDVVIVSFWFLFLFWNFRPYLNVQPKNISDPTSVRTSNMLEPTLRSRCIITDYSTQIRPSNSTQTNQHSTRAANTTQPHRRSTSRVGRRLFNDGSSITVVRVVLKRDGLGLSPWR